MIESKEELLEYINSIDADAIVVEGYECVGKGNLLDYLSSKLGVVPYRPDYNLWRNHDHRYKDRWKVSGFFWDVYSHFNVHKDVPFLFDRGIMSGAVYADDDTIAKDYKKIIRDMNVLNVLVACDKEDYLKFLSMRTKNGVTVEEEWQRYIDFTWKYERCFLLAGADYVVYHNHYDMNEAPRLKDTCEGCGHYSYGYCRHPAYNCKVDGSNKRCRFSSDEEVQDRDEHAAEVHSL